MSIDVDHDDAIQPFIEEGWISEVLYEVKSGKEATVFCCRSGPRAGVIPLIAAKVYRPIESRRFKNDAAYIEGRLHMARNGRAKRAVEGKSAFGRQVQYGTWISQEWEVLETLSAAGVAVPEPLAIGARAILLPFLGDESAPAPLLHEIAPSRATAARVIDELLADVELMLHHHCVHGDLSPYNVMFHEDEAIIIDFPQAVDPRLNRNACGLLIRDVEHICRWAAKHGAPRPAAEIASRLWQRFVLGRLG